MANARIAIGSDHAGFSLKGDITAYLKGLGYEILDLGPHSADPVDFPDYAEAVGHAILTGEATRGVLICGSGVGVFGGHKQGAGNPGRALSRYLLGSSECGTR
jgi:RpiB/LacA/LacB family sugar-phosphate isomerase